MFDLQAAFSSLEFMLIIFFLIPFTVTILVMPHIIRKFTEKEIVVKDMYKRDAPDVPTNGGLVIIVVTLFSLSLISLFYYKYIESINYAIMTVIVTFAFFGLLDDIINIGRPAKLILLYYLSFFLIPFIAVTQVDFPLLGSLELGIIYLQIIIPLYIPVTANLVNMHSGFNGLAPGLSVMVLGTLLLKTLVSGTIQDVLFVVSIAGALTAYYWYERYPSRMFWGNIGALAIGSAIGIVIVVQGFIVSGFIMLIPHVINFLLYVYWRMNTDKYPLAKFGRVRDDGTLEVPNPLTLKWLFPYYYKMNEKQATSVMFALTAVFCAIGFFI
jgi:UDP-N-acetylglucosamine--dolichyl-phosphate N-acetylglucosaminephosphotransferase